MAILKRLYKDKLPRPVAEAIRDMEYCPMCGEGKGKRFMLMWDLQGMICPACRSTFRFQMEPGGVCVYIDMLNASPHKLGDRVPFRSGIYKVVYRHRYSYAAKLTNAQAGWYGGPEVYSIKNVENGDKVTPYLSILPNRDCPTAVPFPHPSEFNKEAKGELPHAAQ